MAYTYTTVAALHKLMLDAGFDPVSTTQLLPIKIPITLSVTREKWSQVPMFAKQHKVPQLKDSVDFNVLDFFRPQNPQSDTNRYPTHWKIIDNWKELIEVIDSAFKANPNACVLWNEKLWNIGTEFPFNQKMLNNEWMPNVYPYGIEETIINPKFAKRDEFRAFAKKINELAMQAKTKNFAADAIENVIIGLACTIYESSKFDPNVYTFYFVGATCFADKSELLEKYKFAEHFLPEGTTLMDTFVKCYPLRPVSIKLCVLDSDILGLMSGERQLIPCLKTLKETIQQRESKIDDLQSRSTWNRDRVVQALEADHGGALDDIVNLPYCVAGVNVEKVHETEKPSFDLNFTMKIVFD